MAAGDIFLEEEMTVEEAFDRYFAGTNEKTRSRPIRAIYEITYKGSKFTFCRIELGFGRKKPYLMIRKIAYTKYRVGYYEVKSSSLSEDKIVKVVIRHSM
jgi:hypothetical protein